MKFEVRVGEEFPCHAVEEASSPLIVNVTQTHCTSPSPPESRFTLKNWLLASAVGVAVMVLLASFLYGIATDDYSLLKRIVEGGAALLEKSAKVAINSS